MFYFVAITLTFWRASRNGGLWTVTVKLGDELLLFNSRPPQWRRYFLALLLDGRYYLELLYYVDISTVDGTTLTMREEISAVIRRTAAWSQRHQGSTMSKKYGCNGIKRGKKRSTSYGQGPCSLWQNVWFPDWLLLQVSQRIMPTMEVELCN